MKKASVTEAKNNLSALLDRVKSGASILIVDRGQPVARLEPVASRERANDDARVSRLVRQGLVRPPRRSLSRSIVDTPPPRPKPGGSVLQALLEERRTGR